MWPVNKDLIRKLQAFNLNFNRLDSDFSALSIIMWVEIVIFMKLRRYSNESN
ncbi:hypothetical protein OENI_140036 [Oenococcus oeni]|uniref:Uncharacterized protein n=1 Tax=Oenococcus oeni TaxID=1247 RepID=A0AAQ2ZEW5_OENOE|nr:hypothetical protein OENI_140036 [Oenococcus oeni]SYW07641.1 hypothetical protein OENI_80044 [Oenococcus oeni]SYW20661.1 hypothetical protein OENI_630047 [Oenococcus oeni]VDB98536.1 protein of unknown function [Oenococcus oeni]